MKSSARHFLVKVAGIDGFFETKTGGGTSAAVTKVFDGGAEVPDNLAGPPETGDVVISRTYDPDRDGATVKSLLQKVGRYTDTVSVTPTNRDMVARPELARVYSGALLVGCNDPDSDSSSGDAARWELTFAVGQTS